MNVSFHIVQTSNAKANLLRDLQFLLDLVQRTVNLKIIPDVNDDFTDVDITRFKNIKILEIHKLDINVIVGIQKLRSQLQELICCHSLSCLSDVLDKCGGDNSQRYSWNDLRKANFSYNRIVEIDDSLECMLSLHTLDLSHNELKRLDFINQLPNLKYLNLSYNKLDTVPHFKGQICHRLQVLTLNNNFLEDLVGLTSLSNMVQLDLSQNCLLDHKVLLAISHLPSLQWLNLQGNPISFHPQHRNLACHYLNKNASTLKFLLDSVPLSKSEKSYTGSLYPISQASLLSTSSQNSLDDISSSSLQEKVRRIRHVTIEDENVIKEEKMPIVTPTMSSQHLEIKRQVEQLRKEYGESWLYQQSGVLVQDVLGFQKNSVLCSTPYGSAIDSSYLPNYSREDFASSTTQFETAKDECISQTTSKEDNFKTAIDDSAIFSNTVQEEDDISDLSDGDDICSGGEECIYLVTNKADDDQVFVVITETHISERDVTTSKEKARWHLNTVMECDKMEDNQNIVKIEFDTLRRDRKQRSYEVDAEECSELFPEQNKNSLLDEPSVTCPKCQSNLNFKFKTINTFAVTLLFDASFLMPSMNY
ncbi:hypothetical protein NQ318_021016 [Aromia moschata]|uniref:Serine/threonine-protein kinase 11-interacting protein PH domain-containing protein n=1 Tax=Aromia moschata TaxID=1265417 RepID=A0AAV8YMV5_9CUCU|nr:hypothetical protein NQ318_021016 [Aromia moschata]